MQTFITLAAALLLVSPGARAQDDQGSDQLEARLGSVEGTVYIHLHGQPDDQFIQAQGGAELAEGDLVRTGQDGRAELTLQGPSVIDIAPNTDFTVKSLAPENTLFGLTLGSFIAKIQRLTQAQQLRFETPTAIAAVRGTELSIQSGGSGEPARVGVFDEGHVVVTAPGISGEVHIGPNQETDVLAGAAPARPHELSSLAAGRARLSWIRRRQIYWRANWRPRPWAQRRAMRRALFRRPFVRVRELQGVNPAQRRSWRAGTLGRRRTMPMAQQRRRPFSRAQQRRALQRRRFSRPDQ